MAHINKPGIDDEIIDKLLLQKLFSLSSRRIKRGCRDSPF